MMQKEYIGTGVIKRCKNVLKDCSGKNIFLVTGKTSYVKSKAKGDLSDILSNYNVTIFSDFSPNPKIQDVKLGLKSVRKNKADIVMAIGGGSAIDVAKLINFFSVNKMDDSSLVKLRSNIKKAKPLIAIPTTAGSGSEATHFAVVYKRYRKYSVAHKYILPDVAIVDANLTISLTKKQIAISAMDALSQAIESYWSINSTAKSKRYAKEAIKLILSNLTMAVAKKTKRSRKSMAKAAHLAGKAINISKTTAPHAVSYALTAFHNIPHGHAVALTLGEFFTINSSLKNAVLNEKRGKSYLEKTMNEIKQMFNCKTSAGFMKKWQNLMVDVGLENNLEKLGIRKQADMDKIIRNVNLERLANNPVRINKAILKQVFKEKMYNFNKYC